MKFSILVVDDEAGQRQFVSGSLAKEYDVISAANGLEASQLLSHRSFSLVITDERMPDMGGIELIRWMRENTPETPVIVMTAYGSVETAVFPITQMRVSQNGENDAASGLASQARGSHSRDFLAIYLDHDFPFQGAQRGNVPSTEQSVRRHHQRCQ